MKFRIIFVFVVVVLSITIFVQGVYINIPGCPSLYQFDFASSGDDFPKCFCDNATETSEDLVQVNCLYFSTLQDLSSTLRTVVKANKRVTSIYLEHLFFNDEGLPDDYFVQHKVQPDGLTITKCGDGNGNRLVLKNYTFRGLENNLTKLIIRECVLSNFPESIKRITALKSLELYRTSIKTIAANDLAGFTNLEYLDMSGNHLQSIEENSFKNLQNLTTLKLSGNGLTSTVLTEINNTMPKLIDLDLSSNNVTNLAPKFLSALKSLENMNLRNNNIFALKNDTFRGLDNLKTLDLRVNILHDTDSQAFHGMDQLNELYLAGNYIEDVKADQFLLKNLTILDLGYNNIVNVGRKNFQFLPNLMELDLRKNEDLTHLDDNALEGLSRIRYANFSNTNISRISENLLKSSPNIETLDLSNTQINRLDKNTFRNSGRLSWLSLATTQLKTLPEGIFDNLVHLYSLDLSGNNWICDQELLWLSKWIVNKINNRSISFPSLTDVKCLMPDELRNTPLVKLYDSKFPLEPSTTTTKSPKIHRYSTTAIPQALLNTTSENATTTSNSSELQENGTSYFSGATTAKTIVITSVSTATANNNNSETAGSHVANHAAVEASETIVAKEAKQTSTDNNNRISSTASIIIAVVVVAAAAATLIIVIVVILTMKRRRMKANRLAAIKNFVVPSSSPSIEMCQRPESNRISDIDLIKENNHNINSFSTTNRNHSNSLYNEIILQQQQLQQDKDTQNCNGNGIQTNHHWMTDRKSSTERTALSPSPHPPQKL